MRAWCIRFSASLFTAANPSGVLGWLLKPKPFASTLTPLDPQAIPKRAPYRTYRSPPQAPFSAGPLALPLGPLEDLAVQGMGFIPGEPPLQDVLGGSQSSGSSCIVLDSRGFQGLRRLRSQSTPAVAPNQNP